MEGSAAEAQFLRHFPTSLHADYDGDELKLRDKPLKRPASPSLRKCLGCDKQETKDKKHVNCSRCKMAFCDQKCQVTHHRANKNMCKEQGQRIESGELSMCTKCLKVFTRNTREIDSICHQCILVLVHR